MKICNLDYLCKNFEFNSRRRWEDPYQMEYQFEPSIDCMIYIIYRIKF